MCRVDDVPVPSTPEKFFEDYKVLKLADPHCRCTKQLPDRFLKGLQVNASVFLQGEEPLTGADVLTYVFMKNKEVYSVEFQRSHHLPAWFIDGFLDSIVFTSEMR